jgi:hypothetical protein
VTAGRDGWSPLDATSIENRTRLIGRLVRRLSCEESPRSNVIDDRSMTVNLGAKAMAKDLEGTYWYCLDHHRVEIFEQTDSQNRIGPFKTPEEAAGALQTIADREKRYEEEDSAWEDDD